MTGFLYARLGKRYKTKGCRMGIYLYHSNVFDCSTQNKRYRTVLPNLEVVVMMMMMNSLLVNHPTTAELYTFIHLQPGHDTLPKVLLPQNTARPSAQLGEHVGQ